MSGYSQHQNTNMQIWDKFVKPGASKNKVADQSQNASVAGFGIIGNLTPFASVPAFTSTSCGSGDAIDASNCASENSRRFDARRPSVNSIDSPSSSSSLKLKLSKSFSKSSEDSDISPENVVAIGSPKGKLQKSRRIKMSKLTKDFSESILFVKTRKNSLKQNSSAAGLQNKSSVSSTAIEISSPYDDERTFSMHGNSYIGNVLMELMHTEKSYVRDLRDIIQGYRGPLSKNDIFLKEDLETIFCNIKNIYGFNRKFLKRLSRHPSDAAKVCQTFLDSKEGFNIYTSYCTNYQRSVEVLEKYDTSPEHCAIIKNCQTLLKHPLPLHTYLFKPVQRILKYHLLLKNISDHYEISCPEYNIVCGAYKCMLTVAGDINEVKRGQEKQLRLKQILRSIQGCGETNVNSLGDLIIEGRFTSLGGREELIVFLMKKGILITKKRRDCTLAFKMAIKCSSLTLVEVIPREPLAFQVMGYDHPKKQCTLQAETMEEKRMWCHEVKTVILDSIKADVPEKARMLLMLPGLQRDVAGHENKPRTQRKMSVNLDYIQFPSNSGKKSPKTSTPINPFFRSKLRKTAFAKFSSEKKNKFKKKIGKRRSQSLENLRKNSFHGTSTETTPIEIKKIPFTNEEEFRENENGTEVLPNDSGFWSCMNAAADQDLLPKKSINRANSFRQAVRENDICNSNRVRSSYLRSLSAAYSESSDEDYADDDDDGMVQFFGSPCSPDGPPRHGVCLNCSDISLEAGGSMNDCSPSFESSRNDSTVTLSSAMTSEEFVSPTESTVETPHNSSDEKVSSRQELLVYCNRESSFYNSAGEDVGRTPSSEVDESKDLCWDDIDTPAKEDGGSESASEGEGSVVRPGEIMEYSCSPGQKRKSGEFKSILRDKHRSCTSADEEVGRKRRSLLKRRSAFCRDVKKFVPRRSVHYVEVREQRQTSLPLIHSIDGSEVFETLGGGKLSLSEDSLPVSPPIDDQEMIDILLTAARESRGATIGRGERSLENDAQAVEDDQSSVPSNRNSGMLGLIELIASCTDLTEEFHNSFNKIELKEEFVSTEPAATRDGDALEGSNPTSDRQIDAADVAEEVAADDREPILKDVDGFCLDHLLRNKHCSYVFRLARAYSQRFKRSSGADPESFRSQNKSCCLPPDVPIDRKSAHLLDPAIQQAERTGLVKQRIKQFQRSAS